MRIPSPMFMAVSAAGPVMTDDRGQSRSLAGDPAEAVAQPLTVGDPAGRPPRLKITVRDESWSWPTHANPPI